MILKNERGALHILSLVVLALALFGVWSLFRSYQQRRLQASVMEAVKGYRQIIENTIQDSQDRYFAEHYLQRIQDIIERNQSTLRDR